MTAELPESPPGGWDEVIVGAGSAGTALAARLAERGDRSILLLEAGEPWSTTDQPRRPLGHSVLVGANWPYEATIDADADGGGGRRFPYPMGRTLGGSSAVNAAIALRALPADFADWAAAGNPDWSWDRVLPYYRRLEADADMAGAEHGATGPIPIRRPGDGDRDPLVEAFAAGCRRLGVPPAADLNAGPAIGVGPVPSNARNGARVSTVDAYLAAGTHRSRLTVCTGRSVSAVLIENGRAVGVQLLAGSRAERIPAGRVTLCAGAINTPAILRRSGIACAASSTALGVRPVADLPGVGANLADHAAVAIWALPRPPAGTSGPVHAVMARLASHGSDPDLALFLAGNIRHTDLPVMAALLAGRVGAAISAVLLRPTGRGRVELRDAAPDSPPLITLRLAAEADDLARLAQATRIAWQVLRSAPLADLLGQVFVWTDRMVADDALLHSAIRRFAVPLWHPSGTARMGPADDPDAVVDQRCRVHGVAGLQVVDGSVMPAPLRATPNLSCVMLAERVVEWMA